MMLKVVIFEYLNNIYSYRKIESTLTDRVSFMWLSGRRTPDHNTINRFRSFRLKDSIRDIFIQVVRLLVEMGHLSLETVYPDGTKIESRANCYTFVWRKSVEKHMAKLEEKNGFIQRLLIEQFWASYGDRPFKFVGRGCLPRQNYPHTVGQRIHFKGFMAGSKAFGSGIRKRRSVFDLR
jgi:hypothetical protein